MAVHEARMEAAGKAHVEARGQVLLGAETWQFFAFVFAAAVTFLLALLDEIPAAGFPRLRFGLKVLAFAVTGYVTLIWPRGRKWLVGLLMRFKEEG